MAIARRDFYINQNGQVMPDDYYQLVDKVLGEDQFILLGNDFVWTIQGHCKPSSNFLSGSPSTRSSFIHYKDLVIYVKHLLDELLNELAQQHGEIKFNITITFNFISCRAGASLTGEISDSFAYKFSRVLQDCIRESKNSALIIFNLEFVRERAWPCSS